MDKSRWQKKEHIWFHYLLREIQQYAAVYFNSSGSEYVPQKVLNKSNINQLLTIYLEYKIMILLYVDFIVLLS